MNVYVTRSFAGGVDAYDVFFLVDDLIACKRMVAHFQLQDSGPPRLQWEEYEEGVVIEPTLRLSGHEVAVLKAGLDAHGPTTQDGLALAQDAIKVRDRLLTMIEALVVK